MHITAIRNSDIIESSGPKCAGLETIENEAEFPQPIKIPIQNPLQSDTLVKNASSEARKGMKRHLATIR